MQSAKQGTVQSDLAAKNVKVFSADESYFGIPFKFFVMGMGFALLILIFAARTGGFLYAIIADAVFLLAYFPAMAYLHKEDPRALAIWIRMLSERSVYYLAGSSSVEREVVFYKDDKE